MELLGDIGHEDQLTAAREENKVLQQKCKEFKIKIDQLTIENESLKIEVEMYRTEAATNAFHKLSIINGNNDNNNDDIMEVSPRNNNSNNGNDNNNIDDEPVLFIKSGNGIYCKDNIPDNVTLSNLHNNANLLCCSLSPDDIAVVTGGADGTVRVTQWGAVYNNNNPTSSSTPPSSNNSTRDSIIKNYYSDMIQCDAPVISTSNSTILPNVVAAGCMDGKVHLVSYQTKTRYRDENQGSQKSSMKCHKTNNNNLLHHTKYIKKVTWSSTHPMLATASADGTVNVYNVIRSFPMIDDNNFNDDDDWDPPMHYDTQSIQSLHFPGPVECITFNPDGTQLICHARGTPYLSIFDMTQDFQLTKLNLNEVSAVPGTRGFTDHVSFTVMDLAYMSSSSHNNTVGHHHQYLACATDTSRNIILDLRINAKQRQVRNLYGHQNDHYSQPKIAWSLSGQYMYGNTQDNNELCVWDIASSKIIHRVPGHTQTIRDIYSSNISDTVVTTSFDKQTKFWFSNSAN